MRECKMDRIQQGFTLIELMIVVAIIAILAALALPAYQDYTIRAQVSEGAMLAGGAKSAMTEFLSNNASWPTDNTEAGLSASTDIQGKYVASTDVSNPTGRITLLFGNQAHGNISGDLLVFSAITHAGSIEWTCRNHSTVDGRYLPSACRN